MSLQDLVSIAGFPGLDLALSLACDLYQSVQNVKVYREQCKDLSRRCNMLLLAVRDNSPGMEGTEMLRAADEVEALISRANMKAQNWANLSRVKSFLNQGDIKDGLDKLYKDIDIYMAQFHITGNLEIGRGLQDLAAMQARDQAENRETLQTIVKNVDDMKTIIGMKPTTVEHFMQTIQEELQVATTQSEPQQQVLQQGLRELHRRTAILPPMAELTGQVVKTSEHPVAFGAYNDVYTGEWLGEDKVALKLARAVNHTQKAQKRFLKEVEIWRTLQHPHVSRLYGIVYFGDHVYSVSPWMENRDAITYVSNYSQVDRLKLCSEVASGMEYLHLHKVVHGDLRGANILISETGAACISDFGLSKVIEEVSPETSLTNPGASPVRWQAPELVKPEDYGFDTVSVTTATDVWSYGMFCIELMTGERPFNNRPRDANVIQDIVSGKTPDRPGADVISRGFSDGLWTLLLQCWRRMPSSRPSMTEVRAEMKVLQSSRSNVTPEQSGVALTESPRQIPKEIGGPSRSPDPSPSSYLTKPHPDHRQAMSPATTIGFHPLAPSHSRRNTEVSYPSGLATSIHDMNMSPSVSHRIQRPSVSTFRSLPSERSPQIHVTLPDESTGLNLKDTSPSPTGQLLSTFSNLSTDRRHSVSSGDGFVSPEPSIDHTNGSQSPKLFLPSVLESFGPLWHHRDSSLIDRSSSDTSSELLEVSSEVHMADMSVIHQTRDGSVEAGTLRGLVEKLTKDSPNFDQDVEFKDVFLTTYRAFSSAGDIYKLLVRRFHGTDMDSTVGTEVRVFTRYLVIRVLNEWLKEYSTDTIDMSLLTAMRAFVSGITTPPTIAASAKGLLSVIEDLIHTRTALSPDIAPGVSSPNIPKSRDITPKGLAIALTILEIDRFKSISSADFISYLLKPRGSNNITNARVTNNKIVNWVKKSCIRSNRMEERSETLKFFVNTAEECRRLNNFSSMSALVAALDSSTVSRLRLTRSRLEKPVQTTLKQLSGFLDPKHNHGKYRHILKGRNGPCVPWLAVHLKDLYAIFTGHQATIERNGLLLINFERYTRVTECIKHVLCYKENGYDLENFREAGPLAYLETELRRIKVDPATDNALEARSWELQRQEELAFDRRVLELHAVGFEAKIRD